eukprot:CAMPEP_0202966560 /NCGR_PEP_ID=MMETSP1396-20130829/11020_1 /ASSEMBLY_ACC=CAM_ASM_000872 /TAXON_ID= /ORGANISM="Pseudokeronopsis sp., Strain Brazil" /LENGTH=58 /DNA_ID=CAMNT_0049690561 /DNA_START=1052 /DNA_END=1228 /DNA_ORIENTATION=+
MYVPLTAIMDLDLEKEYFYGRIYQAEIDYEESLKIGSWKNSLDLDDSEIEDILDRIDL